MGAQQASLFIGVDGGGSGCRARIEDAVGAILGTGAGGPANATTDLAQCIGSVTEALSAAIRDAGLSRADLSGARCYIGLAGALGDPEAGAVARAIALPEVKVSDDRVTFMTGALGGSDGALMAIGTGTIIGAQHGGRQRFVGGWGLQVSDQASGAWLGRALLEHVLLCHDGLAAHSDLTRETLARFPEGPRGIVNLAAAGRPADYAPFARHVVAAARSGDPAGRALMQRGADYLIRALEVLEVGSQDRLCLAGGVGPHYAAYLPQIRRDRIAPPLGDALDGALILARAMDRPRG